MTTPDLRLGDMPDGELTLNAVLTAASELGKLSADFPGWHVWQSSAGRWWAVRLNADWGWHAHVRWQRTVDADTLEDMRIVLAFQERIFLTLRRYLAS
jgi:hypothetical protein